MENKNKLKSERKKLLKELKSKSKDENINYKIYKSKLQVTYIKTTLYVTGILIILFLPFSIADNFIPSIGRYQSIIIIGDIILTIIPIFFGFCLFKSFEWRKELEEKIEDNIIYNIDFINSIKWQFDKTLSFIKNIEKISNKDKEELSENKLKLITELNELLIYTDKYIHFNTEKFNQKIIYSLRLEWNHILRIFEFLQLENNEDDNKTYSYNFDAYTFIYDKKFSEKKISDTKELNEDIYLKIVDTMQKITDILNTLKKILKYIRKYGIGTSKEKHLYNDLIKNYVHLIKSRNIKKTLKIFLLE